MSDQRLNPQIKTIDVGVRHLRSVKVYPLSVSDQFSLTEKLAGSINEIVGTDLRGMSEVDAVKNIQAIINTNLGIILGYVCDEEDSPRMEELTNQQLSEIVNVIFEVNYEGLIKNLKDLFERGRALFPKLPKQAAPSKRTKKKQ